MKEREFECTFLSLFLWILRFFADLRSTAEAVRKNTKTHRKKHKKKEVNFTKIFQYFKLSRALFVFLVGSTSFSAL